MSLQPGGPGLTLPARRPSKLNAYSNVAPGLPGSGGAGGGGRSGSFDSSSANQYTQDSKLYPKYRSASLPFAGGSHHAPPLRTRVTALFRSRVPLIAVVPFFLLGYLFAPSGSSSSKSNSNNTPAVPSTSSSTLVAGEARAPATAPAYPPGATRTALSSYQQGKQWAQKLLRYGDADDVPVEPVEHFTIQDGLLYFPPAAKPHAREGVDAIYASLPPQRHPILHLVEKAEQDWEDLLENQSSALAEAVTEYKRRYKRAPPKGFDAWWKFANDNNIQLVDEYDTIMRDIEPFFALPPRVLQARAYQMANDPTFSLSAQSFTMVVKNGELEITGPLASASRAEETRNLMRGFAKFLPDLQVTFTGHDGPGVFIAGENKEKYLRYAREGRFLSEREAEETGDLPEHPGWSVACPPRSNWRRSMYGNAIGKPATHSFIADVEDSSDVCKHPEVATQHGFFLWNGPMPWLLYPLFTWAKTSVHSDILVTPLEQYHLPVGPDPKWEDKPHNKLLWRGSTTGAAFNRDSRWRSSQRSRLVLMGNEQDSTKLLQYSDDEGVLRSSDERMADLNDQYLDVAFTGRPAQCVEGDGTCDAMARVFKFAPGMGQEEANQYRYIFDMDGNGWSGRFHRLLMSNSAIMKSTVMPEWYQQRIMPWVHYIPVKVDYTDLYDILAFFIGGPNGEGAHDELGKKIAKQGQEWAKYHWREVDMQAYLYRLLLEYARLLERTEEEPDKADYKA